MTDYDPLNPSADDVAAAIEKLQKTALFLEQNRWTISARNIYDAIHLLRVLMVRLRQDQERLS